ncbi:MAG: hypothetical protein AB1782_17630 [Cyanobacteriota bacterium]
MNVLVIKNTTMQSLSTLEDYLEKRNISHKIVSLLKGECLPNINNFDTLVILGGYMSANDESIFPFIRTEIDIVKEFISKRRKILGICLGSQIIAKALNAKVYKGPNKEIGWFDFKLNINSTRNKLFTTFVENPESNRIDDYIKVFHWHGDTFDIPEGCYNIGSTDNYMNQGFIIGDNVFAMQFHFEISYEMIKELVFKNQCNQDLILNETMLYLNEYSSRAKNFYKNFFI